MLEGILTGLLLLAGAAAGGQEPVAETPVASATPEATDFHYRYLVPHSPELATVYRRVRAADLLRGLPEVGWLDGLLALPAPITYVAKECGEPSALYLPDTRQVVLCYEMLQALYAQGEQWAVAHELAGAAATAAAERYVWANTRFIVAHETGHALIQLLDLPTTGLQEDAVDQFATTLMQRIAADDETPQQVVGNLRMAGHWFLAQAETQAEAGFSLDAYADSHGFGLQRYFNLQCLLYGSDPERFADIVSDGDLPESRARTCPAESQRAQRSWLRLLLPHLAPEHEMTEAQAVEWLEQRERARENHTLAPLSPAPAVEPAPVSEPADDGGELQSKQP